MAKPQEHSSKGKKAAAAGSSNPYPWMENWYYELHRDEFAAFDAFVVGVMNLGTSRGFTMRVGARTGPQYGSAGTATFYAQCSSLGINSSRYVDDRLALSFAGDYARFLRWWLGTDFCPVAVYPVPVPEPQPQPRPPDERTVMLGRWVPRNPARVCYLGLRVLFAA
jgi:hypothetical protein